MNILRIKLSDVEVEQLPFTRRKEIRVNIKVKVENDVWYLRLPKWLRDLKKIPEVLNWELVVKPHPSGNPLLSEIKLNPVIIKEEKKR